MGRRPFFTALAIAAALAASAAPAFATATGGAAVPSSISNADGTSAPATGGAVAGDPAAVQAKRKKHHHSYSFPVDGSHSFGGSGSRFGAGRSGHTHQGQDVTASEGTPLVSVHSGTVRFVDYQAGGAGVYVVIHDSGGKYEYAYMHLQHGSVRVHEGQHVHAGQRIGRVGHTGDATGPHLHFEVWVGPWQTGGHPVDPLPYLKRWDR